jgi:beta-ribofuranosylaminobenzene 5'-phosphate synthase
LLVSAVPSADLVIHGEDARRAEAFARTFLAHHQVTGAARITVHRALPSHSGLGSGTQLALAVARALAELHGVSADAAALARAVGRARRSAVGTWTFAGGGLVLEGGRRPDADDVAPLLARLPFPPTWRCVVAVPDAVAGVSGAAEDKVFAELPSPPERDIERVAHRVLMAILPAVVEGDLATFGAALSEVQAMTGRWFAPAQGGTFAPGRSAELVRRMSEWGAAGVGQSSWGPAVYGIVEGDEAGVRLADRVRSVLQGTGAVYEGPFRRDGARVWRNT